VIVGTLNNARIFMYLRETITNRNRVMTVVETKKFEKLILPIYISIIKYGIFFMLIHLTVDTPSEKENVYTY